MSSSSSHRRVFMAPDATDWVAQELPTPLGLLRAADTYQQVGIKYPQRATFHSYAELLHAALLEGDPVVTRYVPHPFRLRIGRTHYIPDCYLVCGGQRIVRELKPRGEFNDGLRQAAVSAFTAQGMVFEVLANEAVLARETEALNWLQIIRNLVTAADLDTQAEERTLLDALDREVGTPLGMVCDPADRLGSLRREIALYRLLHRGQAQAELTQQPLAFSTEIWRCT